MLLAIVSQIAPAFGSAIERQAERVPAAEITSHQAYHAITLAPGHRDCAMEMVGVRGVVIGQVSVQSICNMQLLRHAMQGKASAREGNLSYVSLLVYKRVR